MRTVKVTLTDAMFEAACHQARKEGAATKTTPGIATVVRGLLRGHLSRNGHSVRQLDMTDAEYHNSQPNATEGVPGARTGNLRP